MLYPMKSDRHVLYPVKSDRHILYPVKSDILYPVK